MKAGFYKVVVSFGYMEEPHLLPVLRRFAEVEQLTLDFDGATYTSGMKPSSQATKE